MVVVWVIVVGIRFFVDGSFGEERIFLFVVVVVIVFSVCVFYVGVVIVFFVFVVFFFELFL